MVVFSLLKSTLRIWVVEDRDGSSRSPSCPLCSKQWNAFGRAEAFGVKEIPWNCLKRVQAYTLSLPRVLYFASKEVRIKHSPQDKKAGKLLLPSQLSLLPSLLLSWVMGKPLFRALKRYSITGLHFKSDPGWMNAFKPPGPSKLRLIYGSTFPRPCFTAVLCKYWSQIWEIAAFLRRDSGKGFTVSVAVQCLVIVKESTSHEIWKSLNTLSQWVRWLQRVYPLTFDVWFTTSGAPIALTSLAPRVCTRIAVSWLSDSEEAACFTRYIERKLTPLVRI
jgi:hypothetical protein